MLNAVEGEGIVEAGIKTYSRCERNIMGLLLIMNLYNVAVYAIEFAHNNWINNFLLWWSIIAPFPLIFIFFGHTNFNETFKIQCGF